MSFIRSQDIVGDFCRFCWVALTDDNWFQSVRSESKTCNNCRYKSTRIILPPPDGLVKQICCIHCQSVITLSNASRSKLICLDCVNEQRRKDAVRVKKEVIEKYGGECACCSEGHLQLLNIDHINGGGTEHRRTDMQLRSTNIYNWLRQNDFPTDGYRVLCWNCNMSFGAYHYCPHNESTIPTVVKLIAIEEYAHKRYKHNEQRFCRYCAIELLVNETWPARYAKCGNNTCSTCSAKINAYQRRTLKENIMDAYGGQKCVCCGDEHIEFLTLDHIFEDGQEHHKKFGSADGGGRFYSALQQAGYPDKDRLQVMCISCNAAKSICGGCPHQE
jgi:hypothetical protein